ncbi:MAG: 50S ribosomal protein L32 [Candidatus Shapirobacteria bacterium]
MTPLPKRRHSTARQGKRRAVIKLRMPALTTCSKCGQQRFSHQACPVCGAYGPKDENKG